MYNQTLWQTWNDIAEKQPADEAIIHWSAGNELYRWTYSDLILTAEKYSVWLKNNDVKKGEVCTIITTHNKLFYPFYMAVCASGAVPLIVPYPSARLHPEKFRMRMMDLFKQLNVIWIFSEKDLENILHPVVYLKSGLLKGMLFPFEWELNSNITGRDLREVQNIRKETKPSDPLLLQLAASKKKIQKAIIHTHSSVLKSIINYSNAINISSRDKIINSLPFHNFTALYTSFYLPLSLGIPVIQISPQDWTISPAIFFKAVTKEKATISWMPNFALNFMTFKIKEEDLAGSSLESLRLIVNCGEVVRNESVERFYIKFFGRDLNPNTISACYSVSESGFAVSQVEPNFKLKKVAADKEELKNGILKIDSEESKKRVCLSLGKAVRGVDIKIMNEKDEELEEGKLGEVVVHSESVFDGYKNCSGELKEVFKNKWFYTGDLGFIYEENLYVLGRLDDLINTAGSKIDPEDIEEVINDVIGVIPGKVAAFGEYDEFSGTEQICIIAETEKRDEKEHQHLRMMIVKAALEADYTVKKVYLVPPKWLQKTPSGRINRKLNKKRILENTGIS